MPIIITNEDIRTAIGKDLDAIAGKLPADKEFVLVPKEDHIPKSRFDEVNNSVKDYKTQLADRDKQLADLAPKLKGHDDLLKSVEDLRALNTKTVNDYEAKILERDRNYALNDLMKAAKPRNIKAVSSLLDHSKIEFKDGVLKGAAEQIEALKKSDAYLFENADETGGGFQAGRPQGGVFQPQGKRKGEFAPDDPLAAAFRLNTVKK